MAALIFTFGELILYLVILTLTLYGVALGYHWFTYGATRSTSMNAMIVYILGSLVLVLTMVTALNYL